MFAFIIARLRTVLLYSRQNFWHNTCEAEHADYESDMPTFIPYLACLAFVLRRLKNEIKTKEYRIYLYENFGPSTKRLSKITQTTISLPNTKTSLRFCHLLLWQKCLFSDKEHLVCTNTSTIWVFENNILAFPLDLLN